MFIDEWMESIEGLEKEILKLEIHSGDNELLNNIFRRVHSIKGGSSFVGLSSITKLSHEVEFTLDIIRKKKVTVNTELIDSLLLAVDFLNGYITKLFSKLKDQDYTCENDIIYIDFENEHNEELVIERVKVEREKSESRITEESVTEVVNFQNSELDILQTEEFKRGLAKGMKEQYLLECVEHIEQIENRILNDLVKNGTNREAVNEMFRAVHSIKGGTGLYLAALIQQSIEYSELKKFSEIIHTFESLLSLVRDKGCEFDKNLIDISYEIMDYSKTFLNMVASDKYLDHPDNNILGKIRDQLVLIQTIEGNTIANVRQVAIVDDQKLNNNVSQSIRVNQDKIDKMMNMISELLIAKNSFMHLSTKFSQEYDMPEMSKEVKQIGAYVNRISDELQNAIMSIRMVEIKTVFQKMPRVVRDIAHSTNKQMELLMNGENTEIDKTIIEQISDPLVHLIRNAADHGIELPEDRLKKGKSETGTIILRAFNKNKYVYIEIEDDGKGIDGDKIKKKAIEKGFLTAEDADRMTQNQLVNLIFLPGFSTAKQITEVSGRGVGMDIVKSNIMKINGNVTIESEVDKGTKMIIQLPLTLAVSRGLIVELAGDNYIIPLEYISETVKIKKENIHEYKGKFFIYLRGEVISTEWLRKIFDMDDPDKNVEDYSAVILSNGADKYAVIVDKMKSEQEFVVKTLEGHLSAIPGISGSTLLGNGKVVLILNPMDIMNLINNYF
jgi:two-component system chemotaxis sensor kinase CheA